MLDIDGARGEGGGQVLRTSLALAAITGTSVRVRNVRANRKDPGLKPQHAAGARAIAELTEGKIHGADVGSHEVEFEPGRVRGGRDYLFGVETAGSITLMLQTILPAMVASRETFEVTLEGGTDVPFSPSWAYIERVHVPLLRELGFDVEVELLRRGYFPAGGGRVLVRVGPGAPRPLDFEARRGDLEIEGVAHSNGLPRHIVKRAVDAARDALRAAGLEPREIAEETKRGPGAGMGVTLWARGNGRFLGADALGRRLKPAEAVGAEAGASLAREVHGGCVVDAHEADQLPVFLALAGGGSFTVRTLTPHARTVLDLVGEFLPVTATAQAMDDAFLVEVGRE